MEDRVLELLGDDADELEVSEQRERINEIVQFDRFMNARETPSNHPCTVTHKYTNPAIELYCNYLNWSEDGWHPVSDTSVLQENVPEYVPTDAAISTIKKYSPILEIGAGSGYWAYVASEAGIDVTATDLYPPNVVIDDLPEDYHESVGTDKYQFISVEREERESFQRVWSKIHISDHSCIKSYPSHTIFLCHPESCSWTEEVLDYCHLEQKLIFVGQWFPGADATARFFKRLANNWNLIETFPVYDWASMHASGYVLEKCN